MNPDPAWLSDFRERMARFGDDDDGEAAVSIKLRIDSGCFCSNCSPRAHRLIDEYRRQASPERDGTRIVEHESGPEILAFLAATTAGLALTKSVIDLIVAIVKARAEGAKQGDRSGEPFELIIRRFDADGKYSEEKILRIPPGHDVDAESLSRTLMSYSAKKLTKRRKGPGSTRRRPPNTPSA